MDLDVRCTPGPLSICLTRFRKQGRGSNNRWNNPTTYCSHRTVNCQQAVNSGCVEYFQDLVIIGTGKLWLAGCLLLRWWFSWYHCFCFRLFYLFYLSWRRKPGLWRQEFQVTRKKLNFISLARDGVQSLETQMGVISTESLISAVMSSAVESSGEIPLSMRVGFLSSLMMQEWPSNLEVLIKWKNLLSWLDS